MIIRAFFLMVVGFGAMLNGAYVYGKEPTDIEKTGLAYQYFGENGVSECMIVMGIVFFIIGFLVARHEWKNYKKGKE